jgi:hypothetical protein
VPFPPLPSSPPGSPSASVHLAGPLGLTEGTMPSPPSTTPTVPLVQVGTISQSQQLQAGSAASMTVELQWTLAALLLGCVAGAVLLLARRCTRQHQQVAPVDDGPALSTALEASAAVKTPKAATNSVGDHPLGGVLSQSAMGVDTENEEGSETAAWRVPCKVCAQPAPPFCLASPPAPPSTGTLTAPSSQPSSKQSAGRASARLSAATSASSPNVSPSAVQPDALEAAAMPVPVLVQHTARRAAPPLPPLAHPSPLPPPEQPSKPSQRSMPLFTPSRAVVYPADAAASSYTIHGAQQTLIQQPSPQKAPRPSCSRLGHNGRHRLPPLLSQRTDEHRALHGMPPPPPFAASVVPRRSVPARASAYQPSLDVSRRSVMQPAIGPEQERTAQLCVQQKAPSTEPMGACRRSDTQALFAAADTNQDRRLDRAEFGRFVAAATQAKERAQVARAGDDDAE